MHVTAAANHPQQLLAYPRALSASQANIRPEAEPNSLAQSTTESSKLQTLDVNRDVFTRNLHDARSAHLQTAQERPLPPLQQLLNDWGKTDSRWDLNRDGKVGVQDLFRQLARMSGAIQRPEQTPAPMPGVPGTGSDANEATPSTADQELSPLQQLLNAWGQTDSEFDLDGDGVVATGDLLAMLQQMSEDPNRIPPFQDHAPGAKASKLEQLLAAWGQSGSKFDLDRDGVVGTGDLLTMLARMGSGRPQPLPAPPQGPHGLGDLPLHSPTTRAAFEHAARSLMQSFDRSQPSQIFDAVQESNLGPHQKQHLLSRLATLVPRGLQISTVG